MKQQDIRIVAGVAAFLAFFAFVPGAMETFNSLTKSYPYLMSFVKFAVLATFGECIGLRITCGVYNRPGFGILPKAVVWGILGIGIKAAFTIFAKGAPALLLEMNLPLGMVNKFTMALSISIGLNCIFAPVFMTLHKITDLHIAENGGTLGCLLRPIDMGRQLAAMNWNVMWGFVFKKTLPFFWIPAHTITFLLPPQWQVLFAAALGVVLGVILAFASLKKTAAA